MRPSHAHFNIKPFTLLDLSQIPDRTLESWLDAAVPVLVLKHGRSMDAAELIRKITNLLALSRNPDVQHFRKTLFKYLLEVNRSLEQNNLPTVLAKLSTETKEEVMSLAQQLRNEGLQQGLQQGMQRGEATLLSELIQQKFGSVSPSIKQRLENANSASLLLWSRRLLQAHTVEEIFS